MEQIFSFDPEKHEYRLSGNVIPSVTQVIKSCGLIRFDDVPPETLIHKAKIGKAVHLACEYYDKGILDEVPDSYAGYVQAYEVFRRTAYSSSYWRYIEAPMYGNCNGMTYGMTADRIGYINGENWILELKTSQQEEAAWRIQLMAYAAGRGMLGYKRKALQLKPDGTFRLYSYNDPKDFAIWSAALALTQWKLNNGVKI